MRFCRSVSMPEQMYYFERVTEREYSLLRAAVLLLDILRSTEHT